MANNTKRTTDLQAGDVIVNDKGRTLMTIRRIAEAVSAHHMVLFVYGPKGGKKSLGALRTATWMVSQEGAL